MKIKKPEGAPLGNKNRVALKDKEIRQLAYKSYCAHLALGKSKRSWCFEHTQYSCTWETFEKYLKDEVEFDPLQKRLAECKGYAHWEAVVEASAKGINKDANTASLQMLMRNKFGWDKQDKVIEVDSNTANQFNAIMKQLSDSQAEKKIKLQKSNVIPLSTKSNA